MPVGCMIELCISIAQIPLTRISYTIAQVNIREKINPSCMLAKKKRGESYQL